MFAETVLSPADLIWPLFVTEGDEEEPIATLPGVSRWSVKQIVERAKEAEALGIPCVALFPNTPKELRTDDGREAFNPDNLMCRTIRAIKDSGVNVGVLTDVALDPYTSHGHDGLVDGTGYVLNDATAEVLKAGAMPAQVIEAPSVIEAAGFTIIDDLLHGYGGGYLPPILGCKSRPAGPVPQEPFRAGQTVVIQPNVVTPDRKTGVQAGEMVLITETGVERMHAFPRGFAVL